MLGYCESSWSVSSLGSQVSTSASRQFMNRSTFSALQFDLVKKPANRHSPPNPQLCDKIVVSKLLLFARFIQMFIYRMKKFILKSPDKKYI